MDKALRIPRAIIEQNAGHDCTDAEGATFVGVGFNGPFKVEVSSSIKYGFLSRPSAGRIAVTERGRQAIRPQKAGDDIEALRAAVLDAPEIKDVYISNRVASEVLPQLETHKDEIELEIGSSLKWNPNPNAIDKVILLDRTADLNDRTKWPEYIEWLCDQVLRFKKTFEPRIQRLTYPPMEGEPELSSL